MLLEKEKVAARRPGHGLGNLVGRGRRSGPGDVLIRLGGKTQVDQGGIEIDPGLVTAVRPDCTERRPGKTVLGRPTPDTLWRHLLHLGAAGSIENNVRSGSVSGWNHRKQLPGWRKAQPRRSAQSWSLPGDLPGRAGFKISHHQAFTSRVVEHQLARQGQLAPAGSQCRQQGAVAELRLS